MEQIGDSSVELEGQLIGPRRLTNVSVVQTRIRNIKEIRFDFEDKTFSVGVAKGNTTKEVIKKLTILIDFIKKGNK